MQLEQLDLIRAGVQRLTSKGREWIVANFHLDVRGLVEIAARPITGLVGVEGLTPIQAAKLWQRRLIRRLDHIPDPTLIVASSRSPLARRPHVSSTPIYYPEATEPNAIVAEVVAVCRGIEGV